MSEKYDPNNPEHVMKRYGWSRKEFDKRMGIVAEYESQLTPVTVESDMPCPSCEGSGQVKTSRYPEHR